MQLHIGLQVSHRTHSQVEEFVDQRIIYVGERRAVDDEAGDGCAPVQVGSREADESAHWIS